MAKNNKHYLTPGETARLLMVSPITVRAWAAKGMLPFEATAGGHRRFLRETVENFAKHGRAMALRKNLRILIVDDDHQVAGFLAEWLSGLDEPFTVESAVDGFDAGSKIHTFEPDVVLLDLMMPKLDGFEVCRKIKANANTRDIRVIALTGYMSLENQQRILLAGAETCIAKPVDTLLLLELLKADLR